MPNGQGPPDKVIKFSTQGLSSQNVLNKLNDLANQGYSTFAVGVNCTDGPFVFVGGYES